MIRRIALIAVACLALLCGGIALGGHPDALPGPVADLLVGGGDVRVVAEAIDEVHDRYYREIPRKELADSAIAGVVSSLDDRFSQYFDAKEYASFKQSQDSEFTGVGISVAPDDDGLRIVEVYDGSPAKRAKLERGDVITAVEGKALKGLTQERAVTLIKGEPGSDVRLRVRHAGTERELTVSRAIISVPAVASRMVTSQDRKVGVVRLAQFSSGAHAELYTALRKLERDGAKGLVFDLRHNPGGLVNEAQLVASAFLKDGAVVTTKGRAVAERTLDAGDDPVAGTIPLVVLVDGDSASAAEIVAGALQDRGRAKLVGTHTFGKGVFQQVLELSNGGALDITAGQYFTPKGRNLGGKGTAQGAGLQPDVQATDDPDTQPDEALATALKTLGSEFA